MTGKNETTGPHQDMADMARPARAVMTLKHAVSAFAVYLVVSGVIAIWVHYTHAVPYRPWWLALVALIVALLATALHWYAHTRRQQEMVAIGAVLALSLVGLGVTDYSPAQSYKYWAAMTFILAAAALAIGWSRAQRQSLPLLSTLGIQLINWAATGVAIIGVFLLLKAGRLNYENTGLVLLLVLGLAAFLDGYRINWRFSLVGVLLFLSAIAAAFLEQYVWVVLFVMTALAALILFLEFHKRRKHRKQA